VPIYLDYHATTPVDPRVVAAMLPYFTEHFGNASSRTHAWGWRAGEAGETARRQFADLIGAHATEVVFTSGATESNNLAIKGVVGARRGQGNHLVTCATEHHAVLDTCHRLEAQGCRVTYLPVGADGLVDVAAVEAAIAPDTVLVSIMAANNEIGVLQPIAAIGALARARGVVFHTDAVQAAGKVPFDVDEAQVDLASLTAHKMYGPKGIGALYVRRRKPAIEIAAQIDGGGQERGLRPGTLNVPGIVGFGAAAALCRDEMAAEGARLRTLRDRLWDRLRAIGGVTVNGSMEHRLPHNLNVAIADVDGESLVLGLGDIALSSGSACTSASREASHVLKATGLDDDLARASLRFGLGRWTTEEETDTAADRLTAVVRALRERSR
jgi:cysteine desulfurase